MTTQPATTRRSRAAKPAVKKPSATKAPAPAAPAEPPAVTLEFAKKTAGGLLHYQTPRGDGPRGSIVGGLYFDPAIFGGNQPETVTVTVEV